MTFKHGDKIEWPNGEQGIVHRPHGHKYYTVLADGVYRVCSESMLLEAGARVIETRPALTPEVDVAARIMSGSAEAVRKYTEHFMRPIVTARDNPLLAAQGVPTPVYSPPPRPPVSRRLRGYCS